MRPWAFWSFCNGFFVITDFIKGNLVFSHRFKYYLNKKRLARAANTQARERHFNT
jgi:hypothetical protein